MEILPVPLHTSGIFKDGELAAIVVYNGKPTYYIVKEMTNSDMQKFLEVDRAQTV